MGEETKLRQLTSWIIVIAFVIGVVFVIVIVFLCAALGKEALLLTIGSNSDILFFLELNQLLFSTCVQERKAGGDVEGGRRPA